MKQEFKHLREV